MADRPLSLRTIKATFTLGADTYTEHVNSWEFAPNTPVLSVTDINGKVHKIAADEADWTLNLGLTQDYSATGLAKFMLDHAGDDLGVTIVDGPATWTSTITAVHPNIGGSGATIGQAQLALPCTAPVWAATA